MHLINGKSASTLSVTDRGLLYGQSVFETIAVFKQKPLLLDQHLDRLERGCRVLSIELSRSKLYDEIEFACANDNVPEPLRVARVTVTAGIGGRGYMNPVMATTSRIISMFDYPDLPVRNWNKGIILGVVDIRLSCQPVLAGIKHSNRLEQVIARSQWLPGWNEALMLNQDNQVIEGTHSNVFIVNHGVIQTPDLSQCGIAGVMRDQILETANSIGVSTEIVPLSLTDVIAADEVFTSNSIVGLWPVRKFQTQRYSNFKISHKILNELRNNGVVPTF